ncbi:unnamed protein product [Alopecurus aequalis]
MATTCCHKKVLIDDVAGWIKIYNDGSVERPAPPTEAHQLAAAIALYDVPRNGVTVHDIQADPPLRLYLPAVAPLASRRLPVLLHFHASVFCISDPTWAMYHSFYARLAASIPVAGIVSITLPLAPENPLPAAIAASYAAIDWLKSLARPVLPTEPVIEPTYDPINKLRDVADLSRVFLIGDSFGANLVHQVAAGFSSAEPGYWGPSGSPEPSCSTPGSPGTTRDHPYIWPVVGDVAALAVPPMLVSIATLDSLRDRQVEYCNAMQRTGKHVEVALSPGVDHIFYLKHGLAEPADEETAARVAELIDVIGGFVSRRHGCVARL